MKWFRAKKNLLYIQRKDVEWGRTFDSDVTIFNNFEVKLGAELTIERVE